MKDTSERKIDQEENKYIQNRNNPDWPLAVKTRKPSNFVSNKQIRGVKYGYKRPE